MTKFNYNLYTSISKLHQENLHASLKAFLVKKYSEDRVVELEDGFVYAVGDIPIMLVAHMDTVHTKLPTDIFFDREKQVIWSPQGLGADDRAGVYGIIELIKRGHRPHVLFTWDEEVGALGAQVASTVLNPEVDFVIELDRRGSQDCVFYDCDNPDFEKYIESFGFKTEYGSFSDICYLCPEWKVAGVNLSIGYMNEHTTAEHLRVDWMMDTLDKVEKILYNKEYDKEKFIFIESTYTYGLGSTYGSADYWTDWGAKYACGYGSSKKYSTETSDDLKFDYDYKEAVDVCDFCGVAEKDGAMFPFQGGRYCDTCYDTYIDYCFKCRKAHFRGQDCECK